MTDAVFCDEPGSNVTSSRTTEGSGENRRRRAVRCQAAARAHVHVFFEEALIHQRDHYPHNPAPLGH